MRELVEQGFEVQVVPDATAAAQVGEWDGFAAAVINFRMIASHVAPTKDTVRAIKAAYAGEIARESASRKAQLERSSR